MMAMISASTMLAKAHYDGGGVTVLLMIMLAKVMKKMLVMMRMEMKRMEMVMMMMTMMMMMVMMITIMIMMTIVMMLMTATSETSRHPPMKNRTLAAEVSQSAKIALPHWARASKKFTSHAGREASFHNLRHLCSESVNLKSAVSLQRCCKSMEFERHAGPER